MINNKEEENLYTILYISTINKDYADRLPDILTKFREMNSKNNITGLILYYDGNIIQCIEGIKENVHCLYNNICNDPRHFNIIKLIDEKITARNFLDWDLGFKEITYKEFLKFSLDKLVSAYDNKKIKIFFQQFLNSFVYVYKH